MSHWEARARKRRARILQVAAEVTRAREDPVALAGLLKRLAASDIPIHPIAKAVSQIAPLDDDERAMVEEAVAPHLCKLLPGEVRHRQAEFEAMPKAEQDRRRW